MIRTKLTIETSVAASGYDQHVTYCTVTVFSKTGCQILADCFNQAKDRTDGERRELSDGGNQQHLEFGIPPMDKVPT